MITVNHIEGQEFYNIKNGTKYTKAQLQALSDSGIEVVYMFDALDYL